MSLNPRIDRWQDQVVWIVGASTGIGRATAERLLDAGAQVVVSARSEAGLQAIVAGRPNAHQGVGKHLLASGQLEDRFLDGLHLVRLIELARSIAIARRLVAHDEGLRCFPGGWPQAGIGNDGTSDQEGGNQPSQRKTREQSEQIKMHCTGPQERLGSG